MKLGVITEEQANYYVEIALKTLDIDNILSIKCNFEEQCDNQDDNVRYEVYYIRKINGELKKVLLPLSFDHYYILLHKGLTLEGYQVKKIRRRVTDDAMYYGISYCNNLEKPDFIKK